MFKVHMTACLTDNPKSGSYKNGDESCGFDDRYDTHTLRICHFF